MMLRMNMIQLPTVGPAPANLKLTSALCRIINLVAGDLRWDGLSLNAEELKTAVNLAI
jgi:hypothetical protein